MKYRLKRHSKVEKTQKRKDMAKEEMGQKKKEYQKMM